MCTGRPSPAATACRHALRLICRVSTLLKTSYVAKGLDVYREAIAGSNRLQARTLALLGPRSPVVHFEVVNAARRGARRKAASCSACFLLINYKHVMI